jgi:hypothetical protein
MILTHAKYGFMDACIAVPSRLSAPDTIWANYFANRYMTGRKIEKPKNGKGCSVKYSQKATEVLRVHRTRQNEERGVSGLPLAG